MDPVSSQRAPLKRRLLRAAGLLALIVLGCSGLYYFVLHDFSDTATGSPRYAARWRAILEQYPDPESAQAAHPEIRAKRFPNGEWVFGVDRDSHRNSDGGTVVVKDSTGKVRVFFGHVCGCQIAHPMSSSNSLEEFYSHKDWRIHRFEEQSTP